MNEGLTDWLLACPSKNYFVTDPWWASGFGISVWLASPIGEPRKERIHSAYGIDRGLHEQTSASSAGDGNAAARKRVENRAARRANRARGGAYFGLLDELPALLEGKVDLVMVGAIKNLYIARNIERTKQLLYAA